MVKGYLLLRKLEALGERERWGKLERRRERESSYEILSVSTNAMIPDVLVVTHAQVCKQIQLSNMKRKAREEANKEAIATKIVVFLAGTSKFVFLFGFPLKPQGNTRYLQHGGFPFGFTLKPASKGHRLPKRDQFESPGPSPQAAMGGLSTHLPGV